MGEYIKHPQMANEQEIKIGVCRGDFWETYLTKKTLEELRTLGFKEFYGGEFVENKEGEEVLDSFIENYDKINTSFVDYKDLMEIEVDVEHFELLKEELLDEDIILVLFKEDKQVLVTDNRYVERVNKVALEHSVTGLNIIKYQYSL